MRSELFTNNLETAGDAAFSLQNSKMLKVKLNGSISARQGSMICYQGQADFNYQGAGGIGKMIKQKLTGEGVAVMTVTGQADVFFADQARDVHLFYLEGDAVSINGRNVLAYGPGMDVDVHMIGNAGMMSGGLFNTLIRGTGWVAITSQGTPVVLQTDAPTYVDAQAAIAWSAGLQTSIHRTMKLGALVGRGSGEAVQLAFAGSGFVVVQASEGQGVAPHKHSGGGGGGGLDLDF